MVYDNPYNFGYIYCGNKYYESLLNIWNCGGCLPEEMFSVLNADD